LGEKWFKTFATWGAQPGGASLHKTNKEGKSFGRAARPVKAGRDICKGKKRGNLVPWKIEREIPWDSLPAKVKMEARSAENLNRKEEGARGE